MIDHDDAARPEGTRRRENTRQRLIDAAAQVFAEVGFAAASVEAICERAGFTRGAFYSNFDTKEELMLALVSCISEEKLDRASARVREETDREDAPSAAELVRNVLEITTDEPIDIVLSSEIRTRALRDPRLACAYKKWQDGMVTRVAEIIREAAELHRLAPRLPAPELARVILQHWENAAVDAVMAGVPSDEIMAIVTERTARLATALVDPA